MKPFFIGTILALILTLCLTACGNPASIEDNFVILDAQLISVQTHYKSYSEVTIKAQDKQYILKSWSSSYDSQLARMQTLAKNIGTAELLKFDFMVTYDLGLKSVALSRARQHSKESP